MVQLRRPASDIGKVGRRAEERMAKRQGGRLTRASGNMDGDKGDLILPEFLVENKSTVNASLSLQHEWLTKISREALEIGKQPAVTIQFTDGTGRPQKFGKWVMVPEELFAEIQALYRERE